MKALDNFRKRNSVGGVSNHREKLVFQMTKQFNRSLEEDPSSLDLRVTDVNEVNVSDSTKTIRVIVNDISNNDQKSFDEKWLLVSNEDNVDLGCYVEFDDALWLINFKESKSINSHRKFVMKKCNQIIKYKYEGVTYDIPVVVKNLTQYSDGLQDIVYTSMPDAKRNIMYGINVITKNIKLGQRVMINKSDVHRVTHIDDFQYNSSYDKHDGIATAIVVYTALRDTDDRDNNIADNEEDMSPIGFTIEGSDKVMPGGKFKYGLSEDKYTSWNIEYAGNEKGYVTLNRSGDDCILDIKSNMDLIGESFKLISLNNANIQQAEKEISVTGF